LDDELQPGTVFYTRAGLLEGGNITVAVGTDGIIMVDTEFAPLHDKLKAAISKISPLPKYVINTHFHPDHVGGNAAFHKDGATIVAHDNLRIRLVAGAINGLTGNRSQPAPTDAIPTQTYLVEGVPVEVVDNDDGTYTVTYHPSEHGKHTIYANLKHNPVAKSPYTINVKEGADFNNTFIEKFQFTVRTKTKANQFATVGGEKFNIVISGPQGPIPNEYIEIKDLNNGVYTVNYSLPGPGDYNVSVQLNTHDIQGSPYPQGRPRVNN